MKRPFPATDSSQQPTTSAASADGNGNAKQQRIVQPPAPMEQSAQDLQEQQQERHSAAEDGSSSAVASVQVVQQQQEEGDGEEQEEAGEEVNKTSRAKTDRVHKQFVILSQWAELNLTPEQKAEAKPLAVEAFKAVRDEFVRKYLCAEDALPGDLRQNYMGPRKQAERNPEAAKLVNAGRYHQQFERQQQPEQPAIQHQQQPQLHEYPELPAGYSLDQALKLSKLNTQLWKSMKNNEGIDVSLMPYVRRMVPPDVYKQDEGIRRLLGIGQGQAAGGGGTGGGEQQQQQQRGAPEREGAAMGAQQVEQPAEEHPEQNEG